jgi:peptidyl-prolyl cis-trans isomerase C
MTQRSILAIAVAGALVMGGCNNQGGAGSGQAAAPAAPAKATAAAAPAVKPEDVAATVNGKAIAKSALDMQRRGPHDAGSEEKILDELISRELLRQEAEKQNLAADPASAEKLDSMMRIAYSQIAAEHFMKGVNVGDEELKKEYDARTAGMKSAEYKARHILVDNEAAAKDVIAKLQKGAKFDELAKKLSNDPGSKTKGGDLGWFGAQQMVAPFSQAVAALKNGETTQTPVQTQFGWHVIQREDSREQQPPPFDAVKEQIKMMLQSQKLQQHIADLKTQAKIDKPEKKAAPAAVPPSAAPAAPAGTAPASDAAPEDDKDQSKEAGKPVAPAGKDAAK